MAGNGKTAEEKRLEILEGMHQFGFTYDEEKLAYKASHKANVLYTCMAQVPGEEYISENIDVLVEGFGPAANAEARRIAEQVIAWGFEHRLRVVEVVLQ